MYVRRGVIFLALLCAAGFLRAASGLEEKSFVRDLPEAYVPGKTMTVDLRFPIHDFSSFYGSVVEIIPPGWSLVWSNIAPISFDRGMVTWEFELWCTFGISIRYDVTPPAGQTGDVFFDGWCPYAGHSPTTGDTTISSRAPLTRRVPQEYPSIQAAIDASLFGDTVVVSAKDTPYAENVNMKHGVDLIGSPSRSPPVLKGPRTGISTAPHTRVYGFHIISGAIFAGRSVEISNCLITGADWAAIYFDFPQGRVSNCTILGNRFGVYADWNSPNVLVTNCIFRGNGSPERVPPFPREPFGDVSGAHVTFSCLEDEIYMGSTENNIYEDPIFYRPEEAVYTLMPGSPCIDAGDNSAVSPGQKDLLGNRRIMFGGRGLRVDMGAYERRAEPPRFQPLSGNFQLTWSGSKGKTYSVFFSEDLMTWHLADDNVPGAWGINAWLDPIGWPPRVPVRFYRVMEND